MKKYLVITAILFSCQKEIHFEDSSLKLAEKRVVTVTSSEIPLDNWSVAPCTGLLTHWLGLYRSEVTTTNVNNTTKNITKIHSESITKLTGVDSLGNTYTAHNSYVENSTFDWNTNEYRHIHTVNRDLVTTGNYVFKFKTVYTVSSTGEVSVEIKDMSTGCN